MNSAFRCKTNSTSEETRRGVSNIQTFYAYFVVVVVVDLLLKLACNVYFVQSLASAFILHPNSLASHQ